jgi:ligand-binding sensor domain-containing protein
MWVGTNNGLALYNYESGTFKTFRRVRGDTTSLLNNIVRSIVEDKNGNLWIGTAFGLCTYNKETGKLSSGILMLITIST